MRRIALRRRHESRRVHRRWPRWNLVDDRGPELRLHALFASIDTVLVGRRSYEVMLRHRTRSYPGLRTYFFSRTLRATDYPEVTILGDNGVATVAELRAAAGKDIWLSGGGDLFRSLLEANLVDTIELGVCPILFGQGRQFLPSAASTASLRRTHQQAFPSRLLVLRNDVRNPGALHRGFEVR